MAVTSLDDAVLCDDVDVIVLDAGEDEADEPTVLDFRGLAEDDATMEI